MATLNYADKVAINVNPNIPEINKVTDGNMNLIKQVGNQILTTMGVYTDNWSSSSTYAIGDIVIYDNRIFRNLTGTNTETTPDLDTTNWEETTISEMAGGADIPISPTAPSNPQTDDLWIDTSENDRLKYYDGTNWNGVSDNITGDTLPIGSIVPYGSATAPTNWLVCDGSAVSRTTYAELFSVIGTSFGSGDGSTTFNLPNLKGKVAVGQDTSDGDFDTIGEAGGNKQHQHLMPLGFDNGGYLYGYADNDGNPAYGSDVVYNIKRASLQGFSQTDNQPARLGDTANANNVPPYQVVCYIIKAKQSAGLVANVSNTQSDSTTDTYSCDYINGIIESGSNTNGSYTKYADGTLINRGFIGPVTTNAGAGANTLVTYPMAFVDTDYSCTVSISNSQAYWAEINHCVNGKTTTTFNLQTWNRGNYANTGQYFNYIAIGRWK